MGPTTTSGTASYSARLAIDASTDQKVTGSGAAPAASTWTTGRSSVTRSLSSTLLKKVFPCKEISKTCIKCTLIWHKRENLEQWKQIWKELNKVFVYIKEHLKKSMIFV